MRLLTTLRMEGNAPARGSILCLLVATALGLSATSIAAQESSLRAEVRSRELAFARTMAERDLEAFLAFVSAEAVFFGPEGPIRGKRAVAEAWRPFFEAPQAPFSWSPDVVEVLSSGDLALTSGPVLAASGEPVGRFTSIWRRESDGIWRVVFDRGS